MGNEIDRENREAALMTQRCIAVLGGTFNPIHWGHLILAETVRDSQGLDEVVFVPTARPPHKRVEGEIAIEHRLEMVRLALQGQAGFRISTLEAQAGRISYSIDTLDRLAQEYPEGTRIRFIVGADQLDEIESWKDYRRLLEEYGLFAVERPGSGRGAMRERLRQWVIAVPMPAIELSSTEIRKRVAQGRSIRFLTPPAVEAYICQHRLYQT
jgi:nicotinate-nucleotide adenylyltransferase